MPTIAFNLYRCQTIEGARAEAERIRKIGSAEAHAIELVGKAEAERMRMKAHVYKQYGDAAIMNIVLESLPKVSARYAFNLELRIQYFEIHYRLPLRWLHHWPKPMRLS